MAEVVKPKYENTAPPNVKNAEDGMVTGTPNVMLVLLAVIALTVVLATTINELDTAALTPVWVKRAPGNISVTAATPDAVVEDGVK